MTPERWRQIEELYHAALGCEAVARAALLAQSDPEIQPRLSRCWPKRAVRAYWIGLHCML